MTIFLVAAGIIWMGLVLWGLFSKWQATYIGKHDQEIINAVARHDHELKAARDRHREKLAEVRKTTERVVGKLVEVRCSRSPRSGVYCIQVEFDRMLVEQSFMRRDYREIAYVVSRMVESEIGTGKFIQGADHKERAEAEAIRL